MKIKIPQALHLKDPKLAGRADPPGVPPCGARLPLHHAQRLQRARAAHGGVRGA